MFKTKNLHDHFNTNFKKPKQLGTYLNKLFFFKRASFQQFCRTLCKNIKIYKN